ncbi:MAG: hypothetical protein E7292_09555 [Lachnospiraceae bacterium]|nr:hypothetical protein [Lachnospiraceae bacterium]
MQQNTTLDGVCPSTKKDGTPYFRASLTHKRKHISLGSYETPEAAHAAYLEGQRLLNDTGISLMHYQSDAALSFEKWVCLINFRDNGLYLGKPIYVRQKFFYYYLSPTHILKFDMDDLFYYSSHKIMCRGNHYFVADYGMQVNLVSRYGIKNYAVEGRDFRFINGDSTDFRRENLEILNTYHGVRRENKNGQYIYTVRIHIYGNNLVGRYTSEEEAAIAYNKAIDILRKNGINKNYTPNYIEGMSPSRYADIYTRLEISPRIVNYKPSTSQNSQ